MTHSNIEAPPLGPGLQELYPESSTDFFILSNDVTFSFQKEEKGNVSKLMPSDTVSKCRKLRKVIPSDLWFCDLGANRKVSGIHGAD